MGQITIRLNPNNFIYWRTQFVPILRSNLFFGFADGTLSCSSAMIPNPAAGTARAPATIPNPQYAAWHPQDQAILSAIVCSLHESVLGMMMTMVATSHEAWETLAASFASQSMARAMQIRGKLNKAKKLDKTASMFFHEIKSMADVLASIGQPLCLDEFTGYLCAGLDGDYDALIQMVSARALSDPMPVRDVYAQLLATELHMNVRHAELGADVHMANINFRACGAAFPPPPSAPFFNQPTPPPQSHGDGGGSSRGGGGGGPPSGGGGGGNRPTCQICSKIGHVASCC
jgi:uncharacterized membrane protein YgcG